MSDRPHEEDHDPETCVECLQATLKRVRALPARWRKERSLEAMGALAKGWCADELEAEALWAGEIVGHTLASMREAMGI